MKDYESWSDFEINKVVAKMFLPCDYIFSENTVDLVGTQTYLGAYGEPDERLEKYGEFDPCSNPSDAWPIIIENKISIEFRQHKSLDTIAKKFGSNSHNIADPNPLRAAMIVYLMMHEE